MHRYQKETGELRLVSEKYREREDNRRHIVEMLTMLCEEGKRLFPNPKEEEDLRRYRQACKEEAEKLGREIEASRKVAAQPDGAKAESASMTQGAVA